MQSNAKEFFILSYNYTTRVKMCAVGPPICQIACEWKRPEADFDRGLTSLVQPGLSMLNISHKINNSDNALASLACLSLMSLVLSNELVDNIISKKTKNWHILASFPVLLVAGHRCIMHFTLTLINFFQLVKCAIIWELSHPCQGPWHSIWEAGGGTAWKKANRKDVYIKSQDERS